MRKLIPSLLFSLFTIATFAQSAPGKMETIDYIHKRVSEANGYKLIWSNGTSEFIHDARFWGNSAAYENGKYNFRDATNAAYNDNYYFHNDYTFKPEFITSVTEGSGNLSSNSAVGFIVINFSNSLVKKYVYYRYFNGVAFTSKENENSNVNAVYLPYLRQDPTAFERIQKAIMHLKSFFVEKDPFAN